jgi:heme-degrading monooxygenase HmoA
MIVVIFEVEIYVGMQDTYLKMAASLSDELSKQDGFISLERFESIETENKMLSLQLWKDEKSINDWRENAKHRRTMSIGYNKIFKDYKLKILTSIRQYGKYERDEASINVSVLTNEKNES